MLSKVSDGDKMESANAKIEMLRGEENWLQWRFVMRTLLEEDDDLINVCEGNLYHPGNSAEKKIARKRFLKVDRLARKLIVTSVGRKPLDLLLCCTTAHEMWKKFALDALHAKGKATPAKIASKIRKETTAETTRNPEMKIEITAELVY